MLVRIVLLAAGIAGAAMGEIPPPPLYDFGPEAGDTELPRGTSVSTDAIRLHVPIRFFGELYDSLYVNSNGLISFMTDVPKFFNTQFPLDYPVVAPLYSNVDTSAAGHIYYRQTNDPELLARVSYRINSLYPSLRTSFQATNIFLATWSKVGYHKAESDKVNTYQAMLVTDGDESFVELLYPKEGIEWVRAVNDGSTLPDAKAQAGIMSHYGKLYTLKGSGNDHIKNVYRWTNTGVPGSYMFRVGQLDEGENVEVPQNAEDESLEPNEVPHNCAQAERHLYCHINSDCQDTESGFCCKCRPGLYGNGRNCFTENSPSRVSGKLNLTLNGESAQEISLQAYIVTQDGRSYTAVSHLPERMGPSTQFLEALGSVIAWLFARPIKNAMNGFQLTGGVLNHTVDLTFDSGERVHIRQRFLGSDVFNQLRMEGEVVGTLPEIKPGQLVEMADFQEWFTRTGQGAYRSHAKLVTNIGNNSEYSVQFTKDQTIEFNDYCPDSNRELTHLRLSFGRVQLSYHNEDRIFRFSTKSKISKSSVSEDPCQEGQFKCVANSTCIVQDDSFRCVCNPGFETKYDSVTGRDSGCGDVNECSVGTASCDDNAICLNEIGSYSCQCRPGFIGDGRTCTEDRVRSCEDDPSACYLINGYCLAPDDPNQCYCNEGYEKHVYRHSSLDVVCEDVDECTRGSPCSPNAVCYNTEGSFRCICMRGFEGDGINCRATRPESQCERYSCPENAYCVEEGYDRNPKCICKPGFKGVSPYCTDRDYGCSADSECSPDARCLFNESVSTYTCKCLPGFSGDGRSCAPKRTEDTVPKTCLEDECWCPEGYDERDDVCVRAEEPKEPTANCPACHENAKCIYNPRDNEHQCMCNSGFEGDGITCSELELSCQTSEICHENAICQYDEVNDKHLCICDIGYAGDGYTCFPNDECGGQEDCGRNEDCLFNDSTGYNECTCLRGYRRNGEVCVKDCDVQCHDDAECVTDERGEKAECKCRNGLRGDGVYTCKEPGCETACGPQAHCTYAPQTGYTCKCLPGYDGDGVDCVETCYLDKYMCSEYATCLEIHGSYQCRCSPGYIGNGTFCKEARQQEEFMLINQGRATLKVPFRPTKHNKGKPIHVYQGQTAIGIAIDCVEGRVYWSDIAHRTIRSSTFDGGDVKDFITNGIYSVEGLAIDWENRYIYWTDSVLDTINRAHLDEKEISTIATSDLVNPRGIVVDPWRKKVFWTDWNRDDPKIEMADLDGENREVILSGPTVRLPNSLAIDWDSDELCWADAGTSSIGCMSMSTKAVRMVASQCNYPFGLAITRDQYFWTDWRMHKIETATKHGERLPPIDLPLGGDDKLYGIAVVMRSCP